MEGGDKVSTWKRDLGEGKASDLCLPGVLVQEVKVQEGASRKSRLRGGKPREGD